MRLDVGMGRVLKLIFVGLAMESLLGGWERILRFPAVFLAVCISDGLSRAMGDKAKTLYLEDFLTGVLLYSGFGLLAYGIDVILHGYTGKHSIAAIPAVVLALLDRAWETNGLSKQRR